jgi:uncharacterized protein (DUF4415 family)
MSGKSETDWVRVDTESDAEIDTSDIPEMPESFFPGAMLRMPDGTVKVPVKVPPEVLAWYLSQGEGYEERMAAALRIYADAHRR